MAELRLAQLNALQPITEQDSTMAQHFRTRMNDLLRFAPIVGEGSPEGVVEAPIFSLYIDSNGTTGTIEYRKMQADIGGDKAQGWALV